MRNFNNPLDNIRIASPCPANWDEMFGDDRKRHCGECKLNVYNLSGMTRREAKDLLVNSEGRLCVRYFRRADGTMLTKNCPVGWAAVKQRVSRVATAVFSTIAGLFGGIFAFNLVPNSETTVGTTMGEMTIDPKMVSHTLPRVSEIGGIQRMDPVDVEDGFVNGQVTVGKPMILVKPNTAIRVKPSTR